MNISDRVLAEVSVERIRGHIQALEGVRHPLTAPRELEEAGDYIRSVLDSLGYEMETHGFRDDDHEFRNIIAWKPGTLRPERLLLVIAHYDTVSTSPGADDNASGVALLLELATILRPLRSELSILFVGVNLEENKWENDPGDSGLRGSRALARYAMSSGWEIEGVVVLESVAFADDYVVQNAPPGLPVQVPEQGNFIAVVGNDDSATLVRGFELAIERYQLALPCQSLLVPGCGELFPDTRRSDHAPFWDLGYRAIMVTDTTNFRSPHYHRPSDTLETLNLDFAAQVCRATAGLVMETARIASE